MRRVHLTVAGHDGLLGRMKSWLYSWPSEMQAFEPQLQPRAVPRSARPVNHLLRVLVADDDPTNLKIIEALMASKGIVPVLAVDGAQAVAFACDVRFDLILMDLQMPVLDGLAATLQLRHFENTNELWRTPVVAYSSTVLTADTLSACGLDGALAKPCSATDLENCLQNWCPHFRPVGVQPPGLRP